MEKQIYSVSEITNIIKMLLEENLPTIWLEGEISNFKAHYSGHFYFTLKDSKAQISAVMWKSRVERLSFYPGDGMLIHALGNVRVYEKSGRYQLDILQMQPAGSGKLQLAFEQLKAKLFEEGLFSEDNKKPLPKFPAKIGIITSPTGAAIRDILNVLKRRAPWVKIIIRPTQVQGNEAAPDIVYAIGEFNRLKNIDIILLTRGGGSLEDLWAFNEESVAHAIFKSSIPIVSAVGHEIDYTISDFVADLRAPTPSAAAEIMVPDKVDVLNTIMVLRTRMSNSVKSYINNEKNNLNLLRKSYGLRKMDDLLFQFSNRLDELYFRLIKEHSQQIVSQREKIRFLERRLSGVNPQNVLARGYSITYLNGKILKSISNLKKGQSIETKLNRGQIDSSITKVSGE